MNSKQKASAPTAPPDWVRTAQLIGAALGRASVALDRLTCFVNALVARWRRIEQALEAGFESATGRAYGRALPAAGKSSLTNELAESVTESLPTALPTTVTKNTSTQPQIEPGLVVLPRKQQDVWDALAGRRMHAWEIAEHLGMHRTSEDAIRKRIEKIRTAGLKITHTKRAGYWRPDAPPDSAFTPGSRSGDGQ